ncbi:hypothetical protein B9Z55_025671 [Caenorhabditis nigoni]|nr:hypothetical protein B9Z55_025671 [Caenorhabditis nigoni]
MYMIQYYSPNFLNNLKSILRCNCVMQFITLFIACSLQTRQVSNLTPIEIWCYGYVKHFDPTILYSFYFLSQSTTLASVLLIFLTIYLKFDAVRNMNKSSNQKYIVTFILIIPVVVVTGLTIQVFLPIICYLPMFIYLFIVIETKVESLFEQYFIGVFSTFPSLLDSYITLYSVKTYRKQIKIAFKLEKAEQPIQVAAIASQM